MDPRFDSVMIKDQYYKCGVPEKMALGRSAVLKNLMALQKCPEAIEMKKEIKPKSSSLGSSS